MTQYVVTIPDPPIGENFTYVIPGQYVAAIYSVTADFHAGPTLNPLNPPCIDSSGNGRDGVYILIPLGRAVDCLQFPGAMNGSVAFNMNRPLAAADSAGAQGTGLASPLPSPLTACFWLQADNVTMGDFVILVGNGVPPRNGWNLQLFANGTLAYSFFDLGFCQTLPGAFPNDGSWHFIATTIDPLTGPTIYVDGFPVPSTPSIPFPIVVPAVDYDEWVLHPAAEPDGYVIDEFSVFDATLGPSDIQALWTAASVGFSSYNSTVLLFAPSLYINFDDTGFERTNTTVGLDIGNDTVILSRYPAGIVQPNGSTINYAWSSQSQAPNTGIGGSTQQTPIPQLTLPPGYIIASETANIQPNDQWSNIVIWFDNVSDDLINPAANTYAPLVLYPTSAVG